MDLTKLDLLKENIKKHGSVIVAYSGGVDSTFLAKVCYDVLGDQATAVSAISESYAKHEVEEAKKFAKLIGITHVNVNSEEVKNEQFRSNPTNRCYYCKKELFTKLNAYAKKMKINAVLYGANFDDLGDFRPGAQAATEMGAFAPLQEVKMSKEEIRAFSKHLGLPSYSKPSFACLSSRFPYGQNITEKKLSMVEQAESVLRNLGFKQFRVRHHDQIARIEVDKDAFDSILTHAESIKSQLLAIGYKYVTLDLAGFRSGSMNEVLYELKKTPSTV